MRPGAFYAPCHLLNSSGDSLRQLAQIRLSCLSAKGDIVR
jgi:hypothetical protein